MITHKRVPGEHPPLKISLHWVDPSQPGSADIELTQRPEKSLAASNPARNHSMASLF